MWITAKNLYITKCVLWILGAIIIPIFIWWRPSHVYETDKSSIVIENTHKGRKFEFDATNSFGHTLHAKYIPQGSYYNLIVDGKEMGDLHCEYVSQDSYIYDDTHVFAGGDVLSVLGSIFCACLQIFIVIFSIVLWCACGDIREYKDTSVYRFSIKNVWPMRENDFWFSTVFGLYITEESLVKINKFFGFDNPYFKKYENN